ncbi:hypothetical protein SAMN04487857_110188 [Pseudomonas sp. ok272]|uniref:CS1 type fimbrial major subunit n=1 Tax=unclassified Pseudomonas TaxID=196821 RepID=UPI0008BBB149|nr:MULTISPECIES: CS1 type fimbrial major subunit [unclassified Pseudomonas]SEN14667.1 hypothetical protein SAMN04487857_110188 [Pseudomonas sp. ok272]SFN07111.1 hypothetical protein SAMN04487858_111189 [Pseudomonas sp. ok602]
MLKTTLVAVAGLFALISGGNAQALQERQVFEVSVGIPIQEAHVLPVRPDWIGRSQVLPWDLVTQDLGKFRELFDVKNVSGAVSARLDDEAYLSDGAHRIDLRVSFNRQPLTLDSQEVVSAAEARVGKRAELEISAIKPAEGFRAGDYYGTVHVMFDFLAP